MNKRLDRTRGRGRQDDQQDVLRPKEQLQNGGCVGRTKRLLETLTDEEEKKILNLSGIPRTLKIGNPHNGALPLLL